MRQSNSHFQVSRNVERVNMDTLTKESLADLIRSWHAKASANAFPPKSTVASVLVGSMDSRMRMMYESIAQDMLDFLTSSIEDLPHIPEAKVYDLSKAKKVLICIPGASESQLRRILDTFKEAEHHKRYYVLLGLSPRIFIIHRDEDSRLSIIASKIRDLFRVVFKRS